MSNVLISFTKSGDLNRIIEFRKLAAIFETRSGGSRGRAQITGNHTHTYIMARPLYFDELFKYLETHNHSWPSFEIVCDGVSAFNGGGSWLSPKAAGRNPNPIYFEITTEIDNCRTYKYDDGTTEDPWTADVHCQDETVNKMITLTDGDTVIWTSAYNPTADEAAAEATDWIKANYPNAIIIKGGVI